MRRAERYSTSKQISKERVASPSSFFDHFSKRTGRTFPVKSARTTRFTQNDAAVLRALGSLPERGLSVIEATAHRCSHGFAQVLRCSPLMHGHPFPTSYWLVCPHLMRVIGGLEAENAVASMQDVLRCNPHALYDYHRRHTSIRLAMLPGAQKHFLRLYRKSLYRALARGGVGGIAYHASEVHVKCIHLQVASYLALGFHPAAHFLDEQIGAWACRDGNCIAFTNKEAVL